MKKTCIATYECDERGAFLTLSGNGRLLTLEFGDLLEISVDDIEEAFEKCGEESVEDLEKYIAQVPRDYDGEVLYDNEQA